MSYVDRRREERYSVDLECTAGIDKIHMKVNDISIHGLSIIGNATFYQLHEVEIEVQIKLSKSIQIRAVVRDCSYDNSGSRYGLEIFDIPKAWIKLVQKYARRNGESVFA